MIVYEAKMRALGRTCGHLARGRGGCGVRSVGRQRGVLAPALRAVQQ